MRQQGKDAWLRRVMSVAAFAVALATPVSYADDIAFISQSAPPPVRQLSEVTASLTGFSVKLVQPGEAYDASSFSACVLVGQQMLDKAAELCPDRPRVAVFVTREGSREVAGLDSAIYLEPPLHRQVALTKAILGKDRPLGVLVHNREQWQQIGGRADPLVTPYFADDFDSINHALLDLLKNSHALIGIYDTDLYSSENIKNILITAYRQNKPLIGPSSAYIKAGALATTYSDIDDVAQRLSDVLRTGLKEGVWPQADYNPYFKVRFNEQVGRSLNLLLPDSDELAAQIAAGERQR